MERAKAKYRGAKREEIENGLEFEEYPNWQNESIVFPFQPKKYIATFIGKDKAKGIGGVDGCCVFLSKMVPLLLVGRVTSDDS
jgi:hypothetical protein